MKKKLGYIFIISFVCLNTLFADSLVTIYTQQGSTTQGWDLSEFTSYQIEFYNNETDLLIERNNLAAVRMVNSSRRYNCHSYAWYESMNPDIWIDDPYQLIFRQDGSYTSIQNSENNARVAYNNADHSAIVLSASNNSFIAKWGRGGGVYQLAGHDPYYWGENNGYSYFRGPFSN